MAEYRYYRSGFSLIELVIVVVILGIIGAVAIPRMSRGAAGAGESALSHDLSTLRRAIELYRVEHGGVHPEKDTTLADQLILYTDTLGDTSVTKSGAYIYGPYLRSFPEFPVGENSGSRDIRDGGSPGDGDEGWFYDKDTGEIVAGTKDAEVDSKGVPYNSY